MADDYPVVTVPVSARQQESALLCAVGSEVEEKNTINNRLQPGCYLSHVLTRFFIAV